MRTHIQYMTKCIELGKEAMHNGNPPVGSILVKNDTIIGIGIEAGKSSSDVTKHAEIEAIKDAMANQHSLQNTILYTTHEPCIMCSYVIRHHQINTIVFGAKSKHVGGLSSEFKILETENIPGWTNTPKIIQGVLEADCYALSTLYNNQQKPLL